MTHLLAITSSPKTESSVSNDLISRFVDAWAIAQPVTEVSSRDIGQMPPPHLDEATIGAFYTPSENHTDGQQSLIQLSDELVNELEAADVVVIGSPMHNFGVSSALKTWLDHVARVGRTFKYTANGPEGLLKGKKVYVITARGGNYSPSSPAHEMDHQSPYLKTVLGFIGFDDVTFVHAEGIAGGEDGIREAEKAIDEIIVAATASRAA